MEKLSCLAFILAMEESCAAEVLGQCICTKCQEKMKLLALKWTSIWPSMDKYMADQSTASTVKLEVHHIMKQPPHGPFRPHQN